jgi:hypothetical protein
LESYYKKLLSAKNIYVFLYENPFIYLVCQRTCLPGRTIKRTVNTPQGKQWFPERQLFEGGGPLFFKKQRVRLVGDGLDVDLLEIPIFGLYCSPLLVNV